MTVAYPNVKILKFKLPDGRHLTSSSAVAERLRDASCPSIVSFNSVTPREQSQHSDFRTVVEDSSFLCTFSAFGVSHVMRSINVRYLLT